MLADHKKEDSLTGDFRSGRRFLSEKEGNSLDFSASIHIYHWDLYRYDLIETIPAFSPRRVVHFIINNFHFLAVAEGKPGMIAVSSRPL